MIFTRKLSHDEQRALPEAEFRAYVDWLFAVNEPVCRRREARDNGKVSNLDVDRMRYERDEGDGSDLESRGGPYGRAR